MLNFFAWLLCYFLLLMLPYIAVQSTRLVLNRSVGFLVSAAITFNWELMGAIYQFFRSTGLIALGGQITEAHVEAFSELLGRYGYTFVTFSLQLLLLNLSPTDYVFLYRAIRRHVRDEPRHTDILMRIGHSRNQYRTAVLMTGHLPSFTPELTRLINRRELSSSNRSYIEELSDDESNDDNAFYKRR